MTAAPLSSHCCCSGSICSGSGCSAWAVCAPEPMLPRLALALACLAATPSLAEEGLEVSDDAAAAAKTTHVLELTAASFDAQLRKLPLALVEVYSSQCFHCQQLEPGLETAAEQLAAEAVPIPVARISVETEGAFVEQKFKDMAGTPLLVVFRDGREVERLSYGGKSAPEESEKIVLQMRELALAPAGSNEVQDMVELNNLRNGVGLQGAIVVSKPIGETMVMALLESEDGDKAVASLHTACTRALKNKIGFAHSYAPKVTEGLSQSLGWKVRSLKTRSYAHTNRREQASFLPCVWQGKKNTLLLLTAPFLAPTKSEHLLATLDLSQTAKLDNPEEVAIQWILDNAAPKVGLLTPRSFGGFRPHAPHHYRHWCCDRHRHCRRSADRGCACAEQARSTAISGRCSLASSRATCSSRRSRSRHSRRAAASTTA